MTFIKKAEFVFTGEVPSGLEREECESKTEQGSDSNGHQDPGGIMIDGNAGNPQGQGDGEDEHGNLQFKTANN